MGRRKVRIEFTDGEGSDYTITVGGKITREKVGKLMDVVELMGVEEEQTEAPISKDTAFGKVFDLIERLFPFGQFTSADIQEAYEDTYNRAAKFSTISTYLSRMAEKEILHRQRASNGWVYRRARPQLNR